MWRWRYSDQLLLVELSLKWSRSRCACPWGSPRFSFKWSGWCRLKVDVDGSAGVDGGVVDEGVPCVVAVGELGVVSSVGVGLFDVVAFCRAWRICA